MILIIWIAYNDFLALGLQYKDAWTTAQWRNLNCFIHDLHQIWNKTYLIWKYPLRKKFWKIPIPWNWAILPVLKESVAFPKPFIEKFLPTFIFLSYKILCIVSDMYSAPYKRITSSTFILHCLLFWKKKSRCFYFEPD